MQQNWSVPSVVSLCSVGGVVSCFRRLLKSEAYLKNSRLNRNLEPDKMKLYSVLCTFVVAFIIIGEKSWAENLDAKLSQWWKTVSTRYPKYDETTTLIKEMEKAFPDLVHIYTVGKSVLGKEMWVIHMGTNITGDRPLLRPPMKIVANMHGDETVGRALTLMMSVDLLRKYEDEDSRFRAKHYYAHLEALYISF